VRAACDTILISGILFGIQGIPRCHTRGGTQIGKKRRFVCHFITLESKHH